jgi:sugar O-acyltransferase (sialic acid O-acetyltransferase NeuD family)
MTMQNNGTVTSRPPKAEKVVLFGNASLAGQLWVELTYDSHFEVAGFTVDSEYLKHEEMLGLPVVHFTEVSAVFPPDQHRMMVAVGYVQVNRVRADRCRAAEEMGYRLVSYVSSRAATWPGLELGKNCHIGSHAVIQSFAKIGDDVFIGDGALIAHHVVIEDHCFIASGVTIAGGTTVGRSSFLGTGAVIRNKIRIAPETVVGAGAVILQDTVEHGVYLAAAAEELKIRSNQL